MIIASTLETVANVCQRPHNLAAQYFWRLKVILSYVNIPVFISRKWIWDYRIFELRKAPSFEAISKSGAANWISE